MEPSRTKKSLTDLTTMKKRAEPVAWVTAYDLPFAQAAECSGIDMILVGDSGGMVQLGYSTTNPVTMDEMIVLAKAARRGAPNTFLIGDMPQGSYEISKAEAVRNALRFVKEASADAVKCEGGHRLIDKFRAITDAGIPFMGHLGLTPQSTASFGGYRVQGKTQQSFEKTLDDALELEAAGAFAILLEAMPEEPAEQIARQLRIPIYGIGAGGQVDGQLVIMHDLMGFYQSFRPWFAKCYVPEVLPEFSKHIAMSPDLKHLGRTERRDGLLVLAEMAITAYIEDVRSGKFPGSEYTYPIQANDLAALRSSPRWVATSAKPIAAGAGTR